MSDSYRKYDDRSRNDRNLGGSGRGGRDNSTRSHHYNDRGRDGDRRQQDGSRGSNTYNNERPGSRREQDRPRGQSTYNGERGFRGRGDFNSIRGRGNYGGQDTTVIERFVADNMFEEYTIKSFNDSDNGVISECGHMYGKFGTDIALSSNYIRVKSLPDCTIHQYTVTFEPEINSMRLRQGLLRSLKDLIKTVCAFDGTVLYLPYRIDDCSRSCKTQQGNDITINIKYTNSVAVGSPTSATIFNIIVRRVMSLLNMKQIKRHYYDPMASQVIEQHNLEIWPGFAGSLVFMKNMPLYNIDLVNHVMRRQSSYDLIVNEVSSRGVSKEDIERKLIGQIVLTRYNNRTYRIDSIDWSKNPGSEFELKSGEKISYANYYQKQYNISITDLKQPLLASIMKERRAKHEERQAVIRGEVRQPVENIVHLIPELSYLTGITDDVRANFNTMKALAQYTKPGPTGRCNGVFKFLTRVEETPAAAEYLSSWGVELDKHLVTVPARQFPCEKIYFLDTEKPFEYQEKEADWTSALKSIQLFNPGSLRKWILFCGDHGSERAIIDTFLTTFLQCCRSLGFHVAEPEIEYFLSNNNTSLVTSMRKLEKNDYEMAMFVLPPNRKELYNIIKRKCCIDTPIPSQVVVSKTLNRPKVLRNICTKIGIQMSAKIGGEPWVVNIPSSNKMIVGIDVCHETGGSRGNSWLGFTASLNHNQTRYFSRATRQPNRTEIADSLGMNIKMALEQYFKLNKRMPQGIIVYRDGVGDGQLEVVRVHEMTSMQSSIKEVCSPYGTVPSLAFIIVRKRISTRLFSVKPHGAENPYPGSIVDRVLTKDEYPNFYLVSQTVREGSVNPTHFIILFNDTTINTNNLQRLSYKTCHLYFNWSGTVRVPAPCQYAHKLCFLISQSLGKEPSSILSDRLYYL